MISPVRSASSLLPASRGPAPAAMDGFTPGEVAPVLMPARLRESTGVVRPPAQAVAFVRDYTADLKLDAEALKERDANMRLSPAAFYRMFPSLFHADLRGPYQQMSQLLERPSPKLVISGDCHLGNFGTLRDRNETVKWAMNDYDQSGQGSAERDLERLATSLLLLGREGGLSDKQCQKLVHKAAHAYLKELGPQESGAGLTRQEAYGPVKGLIEKAEAKTHQQLVEKFAQPTPSGSWEFQRNEELVEPTGGQRENCVRATAELDTQAQPTPGIARPLEVLDVVVKKGSGGSSKGLQRYYVLLKGNQADPLPAILELKQLLPCPISSSSGDLALADPAQILRNQDTLGGPFNPLSGAVTVGDQVMLAREREGDKLDLNLGKLDVDGWEAVAEQAGLVLAEAHCSAAGHADKLKEWVGDDGDKLVKRLTQFSQAYAAQTLADFAAATA